ncbi:low molecular weight protein-tyrosine-phosphatase [Hydrogenophaga sp.]|jgi:protein-tyrosine phosphatase|uniref:low molecular weight protein-tyrosine-phosphatase n=1 Tax=Hydrogenophaga sp. TaxID=1904254 RepID=UPI00272F2CE7|nr:low molecular weight protein-tyrosine-phosphatase [Hydrogenophaga sp.]MDP1687059.1 low molecular weight protein-tyrosine-phosphatase [Hydrogenophaga sp.]
MVKILLVCMGNICRSPLAASVMHAEVARRQLLGRVSLDSAGTYGAHQGEKADARAVSLAQARGYGQILKERARKVTEEDFDRFDLILAMDRDNLTQLQRVCPAEHRHKLHLFLEYAGVSERAEVPDPYYGNAAGFEAVLSLCEQGVDGVLRRVTQDL